MATERKNIEEVILGLSKDWLGKEGVVAIADELSNGSTYIAFYVHREEVDQKNYPTEAEGYAIVVRPSGSPVSFDDE